MATIHHKVERRNLQDLDTSKRWYATLRKISLIGKKETAQMLANPTILYLEEVEMALAQFKQIVNPLKVIVE